MRFKTKLFGLDFNHIRLSSFDPRKVSLEDVANVALAAPTGGTSLIPGSPTSAGGIKKGVDIFTSEAGREAQIEGQNKALAAEQTAIEAQIELIKTNKEESGRLIDELEKFLTANNIEIERELLEANNEASDILLTSSLAAYNASLIGISDYSNQLIETAKNVSFELKKGNQDVAKELSETAKKVYNTNFDAVGQAQIRQTQALKGAAETLTTGVEKSSLVQLKSINQAADISTEATKGALDRFETTKTEAEEVFTPWIQGGQWANQELQDSYEDLTRSFTIEDFQKEGGYDLRLNQALDTITSRAAAVGVTGETAKALTEYSQDFASLEYGKAYDRFNLDQQDKISYLTGLSREGLSAAGQLTDVRSRADTEAAKLEEREGGRQAEFALGRGDVESGRITSIADIVSKRDLGLGEIDVSAIEGRRLATTERDTDLGEIEADRLGELSRIRATTAGAQGDIEAQRIASGADLKSRYLGTEGQILSQKELRDAEIKANILGTGSTQATNLASMRQANVSGTAANLIRAEGARGSSLSQYYTNVGDIQAQYYRDFNNTLNTLVNTGVAAYGAGVFDPKTPPKTRGTAVATPVRSTTVAGSQNYLTNPENFNFNFANP